MAGKQVYPGTDRFSMAELMAIIMARAMAGEEERRGGGGRSGTLFT